MTGKEREEKKSNKTDQSINTEVPTSGKEKDNAFTFPKATVKVVDTSKDSTKDTSESVKNQTSSTNGEMKQSIADLNTTLSEVKRSIWQSIYLNIFQIILITLFLYFELSFIYDHRNFLTNVSYIKDVWTWQVIYYIFTKAVVCFAFIFSITFLIKLLKSYLHIFQRNSHRIMVVGSMASLVKNASIDMQKTIYQQLLDIIVNYDDTGILKDDPTVNLETIICKVIEKLPPK